MRKILTTMVSLALVLYICTGSSAAATPVEQDSEYFPDIPTVEINLKFCDFLNWMDKDGDIEYTYSEYIVNGILIKSYSYYYSSTNTNTTMYPGIELTPMPVG